MEKLIDIQSEFRGMIENLIKREIQDIHTVLPAKITKVDGPGGYCSCEILATRKINGIKRPFPPIINIGMDYDKFGEITIIKKRNTGDLVFISFTEYAIDTLMNTDVEQEVISNDKFGLNGAVILKGFKKDSEALDYNNDNSISIIHSGGLRIDITSDGKLKITSNEVNVITPNFNLTGNFNVNGEIDATGLINSDIKVSAPIGEFSNSLTIASKEMKQHAHTFGTDPFGNTGQPI